MNKQNRRTLIFICFRKEIASPEWRGYWYHVLSGNMIVPAGCENRSVRYCSVSSPFACAVAKIEYSAALHFAPFAVLL
ncbi:MAG: hypothetical protein J6P20_00450, partial [Oscillospiraceae bacterium]|nr:hypothetical protein [Oscillospiraceae bacterium]